jgi:hypothetical protein
MKRFLTYPVTLLVIICTAGLLSAQQDPKSEKMDPGPFYGFWEFQEPAGDKCILIIKRGGRLSCFWAGSATRAIEKGKWERTGETLTANWEAGHVDVYTMKGDNGLERATYNKGVSLLGEPSLTIRGVRIDSRIPGNLTIKPEGDPIVREQPVEEEARPAIPVNSPFIGYWKVDQSTGIFGIGGGEPNFYLKLTRNGDASVSLRKWEGDQGVRGKWRIDGNRAIVTWPNNRRDVLTKNDRGDHVLGNYKPKDKLTRKPRDPAKAEKVDAAEAERFFDAGGFARLTVVDIRGKWLPKDKPDRSEYISIEGWGNAYRFPARDGGGGSDPGKWRLDNDKVLITWVDGSKSIIRIGFPTFIQDTLSTGQDFSDTPAQSIQVVRAVEED